MSNCPLSKIRIGALAEIFHTSPFAICLIDMPHRQYQWANKRYCNLWEGAVNEESIRGLRISELLSDPHSQAVAALEKAHTENISTEFEFRSSASLNGKTTHWTGALIPVYSHGETGGQSHVTGVLSLLVDVTAKVEATDSAKRCLVRLENQRKRHQDFLRLVAHEFRTPLTVIQMLTQASIRTLQSKSYSLLDRHLKGIIRQLDLLHRFTFDIAGSNTVDAFNCEFQTVWFNKFISDSFIELATTCDGFTVTVEVPSDFDAKVSIDCHRFYQVLANLLTNAIKYSKKGSKITCRVTYGESKARVSVRDGGSGVPLDVLNKIFERSFRFSQSKGAAGSGLGLFLSKNIIKTMNGRIWAESDGLGKGSTFFIELPIIEDSSL